ncbi:AAA family ATPase [Acinetobacter sp. NIPH 2100]|uniref:AAA family ATPase n=1 Tax=Acinetobacter sp. NIPH 2100 TaxID=1217708 RepID=UPI0002CF1DC5|nr:AAA family ATPase [Acinetobacter sp. NIPH 2100]ENX41572.1 hypothetical protein F887_01968 [Acinetobacter sp. NIPH 2100]
MLALQLIELNITVNTIQNKVFSTKIPFKTGLNVIRADNTSGKSTCVNAIAYALGLESILGPLKSKPFPKSLYETINDSKTDGISYNVTHSYVELKIQNNEHKEVTVKRLIKDQNNIITVNENGNTQDYFLKSYGTLGSAKSEYGFHNWLENFMGWELPLVPHLNGEKVKLYLEAIFPLFFIEQKRGWSEIQANVPVNYGIKNVKKTAIEYVLDISNFEIENKLNTLRNKLDHCEDQWKFLSNSIEALCDLSNFNFSEIKPIGNQTFPIEYFISGVNADIPLHTAKVSLQHALKAENENVPSDNNLIEEIEDQKDKLRSLYESLSNLEQLKENLQTIQFDSVKKVKVLFNDLQRYKQLDLLTKLGSENNFTVDLEECPICHNELSDFLHISHKKSNITPMTLEQNILFIKEQYDFMNNIGKKHSEEISTLNHKIQQKLLILKEEEAKLKKLENDYSEVFGDVHFQIRKKIELEKKIEDIENFIEKTSNFEENLVKLQSNWQITYESYSLLKKKLSDTSDSKTIITLEKLMQKNLDLFGFSTSEIDRITISRNTLRPEQNGYDIIAETSASDYIRTIWAFTLALLELATNSKLNIKHGGFVIFDEPRQHEARTQSLDDLIKYSSQIFENSGQAIFTTSFENLESLSSDFEKANIIYFDDYILQAKN